MVPEGRTFSAVENTPIENRTMRTGRHAAPMRLVDIAWFQGILVSEKFEVWFTCCFVSVFTFVLICVKLNMYGYPKTRI